jgi:hypothetical protein
MFTIKRISKAGQKCQQVLTIAALALVLTPQLARAQFVCDNALNATEDGDGASAAGGANNLACGRLALADGNSSTNIAIGTIAIAADDLSGNVAIGSLANARGNGSFNIATGASATARGNGSRNIATGAATFADGDSSFNIATGNNANARGNGSSNIATGDGAIASGSNTRNVAIGAFSVSTGGLTTAVGPTANATFTNSAAFGSGATATRMNQQVFGTATNTYTMSGITSQASRSAQSGPVQMVTSDAQGNLATMDIDEFTKKNTEGVALALAMVGGLTLPDGNTFAISGNWGTFEGENAIAFGAIGRVSKNVYITGGFGAGLNKSTFGGRAGISFSR